ncbi:DUF937 domain-containing protein [Microvirga alba]|uniref:DUF937 domain-containing protein n=1 Tax=Microvirga alba TaxID=2791025 RepID=A0A931FN05_9HYPH|nr:DUF937 domain-containing protein [Microvirga alba]MBF9231787.1 DUF937 domain-containing protein [Microvirga alba]
MLNWFDLMRQAQTSAGFGALAQQFNLSDEQSQKAMAAFMPAFAMGLQRATDTNDPSRFLQSMMSDAYQNFWQTAGQAFSTQAQREGRKLLDQLFGSDDVSRRIAHQMADYVGVTLGLMQQMLPIMAGIMAGSMYQAMSAQGQSFPMVTPEAGAARGARTSTDPWMELWTGWMKAVSPESKSARNPFEEMMAVFLPPPALAKPAPQKAPPPALAWEEMMEAGREMQQQYLTSLQAIFDEAWKTGKAKR